MPKIVDHDQYRNELLDKCLDLFSEKGYMNINMRQIADEMGVSTGTLYHYFSSKLDILMQLLPYAQRKNVAEGVVRIGAFNTTEGRFAETVKFLGDNEGLYRKLVLLVMDLYRNDSSETEDIFYRFYTSNKTAIAQMMSGDFDQPDMYASFLFCHLLGLMMLSVFAPGKSDFRRMLAFMVDMLMREHHAFLKKKEEEKP